MAGGRVVKVEPADLLASIEALLRSSGVPLTPALRTLLDELRAQAGAGDPTRLHAALRDALPELAGLREEAERAIATGEATSGDPGTGDTGPGGATPEALTVLLGELSRAWEGRDGREVDVVLAAIQKLFPDPAVANRERLEADAASSIARAMKGISLKPLI